EFESFAQYIDVQDALNTELIAAVNYANEMANIQYVPSWSEQFQAYNAVIEQGRRNAAMEQLSRIGVYTPQLLQALHDVGIDVKPPTVQSYARFDNASELMKLGDQQIGNIYNSYYTGVLDPSLAGSQISSFMRVDNKNNYPGFFFQANLPSERNYSAMGFNPALLDGYSPPGTAWRELWDGVKANVRNTVLENFPTAGKFITGAIDLGQDINEALALVPLFMPYFAVRQKMAGEKITAFDPMIWVSIQGLQGIAFFEKIVEKVTFASWMYAPEGGFTTSSLGMLGGGVQARYNPLLPPDLRQELREIEEEEHRWRQETYTDPFEKTFIGADGVPLWGDILGRWDLSPELSFKGWMDSYYRNAGVLGNGITWMLYQDRYADFIADVNNPENLLTLPELLMKYEAPVAEGIFNFMTDPINLMPTNVQMALAKIAIPPLVVIEPALGALAGKAISKARVKVGEALAGNLGDWLMDATWLTSWSKKTASTFIMDGYTDGLSAAVLKFDDWVAAAPGRDARMFWMGIINGDADMLRALGLGDRAFNSLMDLSARLKGMALDFTDIDFRKIETITDLFQEPVVVRKGLWSDFVATTAELEGVDMATAEGRAAIGEIVNARLRNDPKSLLSLVHDAAQIRVNRILGITPQPRGSIRRFLSTSGQFLKEGWLAGSIRFNMANALSNFSNAVATGHFINPFDLGAPARIQALFEGLADMPVPNEVMRNFMVDALDASGGELLWRQVPVP
ncbi:MAG: hypothetical protein ACXABY_30050, partial [Candidatus Thorarchaeota archaeon]